MSNSIDNPSHDIVVDQTPAARPQMAANFSDISTKTDKHDGDSSLSKIESKTTATDYGSAHPPISDAALQQVRLRRALGERTIQMIALAGTIGTGLFLGSGRALAKAGPLSILISYSIVGAIVYLTMIALGEMSTLIPASGAFGVFSTRFVDPAFGFSVNLNYAINDAVSVAGDLTACQILLQFWVSNDVFPGWALSLIFLTFLISVNVISVRGYAELEYLLSLLKICTIIIFIICGIIVNAGVNDTNSYLGFKYWTIGDAPFVNGFPGWVSSFVTAAFAFGGVESLTVTAGETRNPAKTIPKTIRNVFWRIIIFYVLALFIIGIDIPYNTPGLKTKNAATSPFTLVFQQLGSNVAASFMNAVVMTSALSAGNHALYAGTRVLYGMAVNGQAPKIFATVSKSSRVPWVALACIASVSGLCFGSSYIGAGDLWNWLQNLVGVSNQVAWASIGFSSIRFHKAIKKQGKESLLVYKNWTQPWGPYVVVIGSVLMILVQGWTAFTPFSVSDFFSYYIEIGFFAVAYLGWKLWNKTKMVPIEEMDLYTDTLQYEKDLRRKRRDLIKEGAGDKLPVLLEDEEEQEEEEREEAHQEEVQVDKKQKYKAIAGRASQYLCF
ncbi:Amino acid permease/ SLC12A domain protein [Kalmanozyma brasiliensis GHG001]|uniref:Amino acid transporter n=1 Tax=Kalmanozyma brasiliensis (strain GHG001) TaxID=1365824 RepID=V5EWY3_KALBG|nr:Amino acid permease/ SLC12A domain protein [Kalmanozyma brasiliensis GHG001]EST06879.1 Amino acid permease/ SLC12A domain protein [Kalmanozyma brasiliensis GHG001]